MFSWVHPVFLIFALLIEHFTSGQALLPRSVNNFNVYTNVLVKCKEAICWIHFLWISNNQIWISICLRVCIIQLLNGVQTTPRCFLSSCNGCTDALKNMFTLFSLPQFTNAEGAKCFYDVCFGPGLNFPTCRDVLRQRRCRRSGRSGWWRLIQTRWWNPPGASVWRCWPASDDPESLRECYLLT